MHAHIHTHPSMHTPKHAHTHTHTHTHWDGVHQMFISLADVHEMACGSSALSIRRENCRRGRGGGRGRSPHLSRHSRRTDASERRRIYGKPKPCSHYTEDTHRI